MKKFASLVLLSAVTLGITCSDVAMAARPESSASIAVSKNNLNNQNKSIKKCEKSIRIIPCNEAQDKDVDVLNKERNIEAKSAISESKQAVTKNETVNSCGKNKSILNKLTGTTGVAVAGTVSILIGSSLLLVQNKKISGKSRKGKSPDVAVPNITIDPENPKKCEEKHLPKGLRILILIYGILAAFIFLETTATQMYIGFLSNEGTKCEKIFGPIGRGFLNGVFLGIPGFVNRNQYAGLSLPCRGYEDD